MTPQPGDTNSIFLTGFLEANPTHREMPGGLPVANVKLISQSRFLSTDKVRSVNSFTLAFYGPATDWAKPLRANDRVYIQGELVHRATSQTANRTTYEVVVRTLFPLSPSASVDDPDNW